jgi:hypothetical protein
MQYSIEVFDTSYRTGKKTKKKKFSPKIELSLDFEEFGEH